MFRDFLHYLRRLFFSFEGLIGEAAIVLGAVELIDSERFPLEDWPISGYGLVIFGMAVFLINGFWAFREQLVKGRHLQAALHHLRSMGVEVQVVRAQITDLQGWFARGKIADFGTLHVRVMLNIINQSAEHVWLDFRLVDVATDLPPVEVMSSSIAEWNSTHQHGGRALVSLQGNEIVKEATLDIPLRMTLQPAQMSLPMLGKATRFQATLQIIQGGKPESLIECPITIGKQGLAFPQFKQTLFNWASTGETVEGRTGQEWVELLYKGEW